MSYVNLSVEVRRMRGKRSAIDDCYVRFRFESEDAWKRRYEHLVLYIPYPQPTILPTETRIILIVYYCYAFN